MIYLFIFNFLQIIITFLVIKEISNLNSKISKNFECINKEVKKEVFKDIDELKGKIKNMIPNSSEFSADFIFKHTNSKQDDVKRAMCMSVYESIMAASNVGKYEISLNLIHRGFRDWGEGDISLNSFQSIKKEDEPHLNEIKDFLQSMGFKAEVVPGGSYRENDLIFDISWDKYTEIEKIIL